MKRIHGRFGLESMVRSALGIVFVLSGLFKIEAPGKATALIETLGVENSVIAEILILALSTSEVVLGLLLITNKKTWFASLLCVAFLLLSTVIGVFMLPRQLECGCFGEVFESRMDEFFLVRNLALLLVSMLVFKYSTQRMGTIPQ